MRSDFKTVAIQIGHIEVFTGGHNLMILNVDITSPTMHGHVDDQRRNENQSALNHLQVLLLLDKVSVI